MDSRSPRRPLGRILRWLAVLVVMLALTVAVALAVLPSVAGRMIEDALAGAGFPEARVHGVRLIWLGLRVDRIDLSADGGTSLNTIAAYGNPRGLLAARLDDLSIGSIALDARIDDEAGLAIAGFAPGDIAPGPPMTALPVDRIAIKAVKVDLGPPDAALRLRMKELLLEPTTGGLRLRTRLDLAHADGALEATLDGVAALPLALPGSDARFGLEIAAARWGAVSLSEGRFDARLSGGALDWSLVAAGAAGLMADVEGHVAIAEEKLRLSGNLDYRGMTLRQLDIEGRRAGDTITVALVSGKGSDVALDMSAAYDAARAQGSLRGDAVISDLAALAPLAGDNTLRGRLRLMPDLSLAWTAGKSVSASGTLRLAATDLETGATQLDSEISLASAGRQAPLLAYGFDAAWRLSADIGVRLNARTGAARVESLTLAGPFELGGDGASVRLHAPECLTLAIDRVETAAGVGEGVSLPCLRQREGQPLVEHDPAAGATRLALQIPESPIAGNLLANGRDLGLTGRWPTVNLSARHGADGDIDADIALEGGRIASADSPFRLSGVTGDIAIERGAVTEARLSLGDIRSTASPRLFAPLTLDIEAQAGEAPYALDYTAFLSDALGSVVIRAQGTAAPASGHADLTLFPVRFVSGALEIGDISPLLAETVNALEGEIGATGALAWERGTLTRQTARVTLEDISLVAGGVALAGLDTDIRLSGLSPPITSEPQVLRLKAVTSPLPLSDGRLRFEILGNKLSVEAADFILAEGRVHAGPFILDLSDPRKTELILQADGVRLEELFRLADVEGLSGDGVLSGRLPLRMNADGADVEDGLLKTTAPGVLRYSPETPPDFLKGDDMRTKMLRQALANFHYDALSLHIDGGMSGAQTIRLEATGRNPDFMEGHPVELTFNLQGALLSTVRSAAILSRGDALRQLGGGPDRE